MHEQHFTREAGILQNLQTLLQKWIGVDSIVTHPDFEQVAQDEDRIGLGVLHEVRPGFKRAGLAGLQVQVSDQVNTSPVWRRLQAVYV